MITVRFPKQAAVTDMAYRRLSWLQLRLQVIAAYVDGAKDEAASNRNLVILIPIKKELPVVLLYYRQFFKYFFIVWKDLLISVVLLTESKSMEELALKNNSPNNTRHCLKHQEIERNILLVENVFWTTIDWIVLSVFSIINEEHI